METSTLSVLLTTISLVPDMYWLLSKYLLNDKYLSHHASIQVYEGDPSSGGISNTEGFHQFVIQYFKICVWIWAGWVFIKKGFAKPT